MTHNNGDAWGMMGNERELENLDARSESNTKIGLSSMIISVLSVTGKTCSLKYGFPRTTLHLQKSRLVYFLKQPNIKTNLSCGRGTQLSGQWNLQ
jgi:hypothetical protein